MGISNAKSNGQVEPSPGESLIRQVDLDGALFQLLVLSVLGLLLSLLLVVVLLCEGVQFLVEPLQLYLILIERIAIRLDLV